MCSYICGWDHSIAWQVEFARMPTYELCTRSHKMACFISTTLVWCPGHTHEQELLRVHLKWMDVLRASDSDAIHAYHYNNVIMGTITSQITRLTIVYSTVYSDADQRKYQSSASLAFVRGIHRGPVNSPHKWPVTRKMFPFDDVIM